MKAFEKGQQVILINDYDSKGTVTIRKAVVRSCGEKRMTLVDETTGNCLGRDFEPVEGSLSMVRDGCFVKMAGGTFLRVEDKIAEAMAVKVAQSIIDYEKARYTKILEGGESQYIQDALARIHEPRIKYL